MRFWISFVKEIMYYQTTILSFTRHIFLTFFESVRYGEYQQEEDWIW